jgi:hypothetical protein
VLDATHCPFSPQGRPDWVVRPGIFGAKESRMHSDTAAPARVVLHGEWTIM